MNERSETLADFIARRLTELSSLEGELRRQLDFIQAERNQLLKASEAAGIEQETSSRPDNPTRIRRAPLKTIKEAIVAVLSDAERGMTALEILPQVNARLGIDYPRTSLSPQLSRLGSEGVITRHGTVWSLAEHQKAENGEAVDQEAHNH